MFVQSHQLQALEARALGVYVECSCGWWDVAPNEPDARRRVKEHLDRIARLMLLDPDVTSDGVLEEC